MINFLTAEFSKILKRKQFYLGLMLIVLASVANIVIYVSIHPDFSTIEHMELQSLLLRFISNKFIAILIVFVVTIFLAGANGSTAKNAITIGYSRPQIYFSKLIIGAIIMLIIILVSMITSMIFAGIWMYDAMKIGAIWEMLVRYCLLILVYITLFTISITLLYIINSSMVFAIIYFILFLVFAEVIEALSYNPTIAIVAAMTPTHQFNEIIYTDYFKELWVYVVGTFFAYNIISIILGLVVVCKKDIK